MAVQMRFVRLPQHSSTPISNITSEAGSGTTANDDACCQLNKTKFKDSRPTVAGPLVNPFDGQRRFVLLPAEQHQVEIREVPDAAAVKVGTTRARAKAQ